MSALLASAATGEISFSAATTKTLMTLTAAANHAIKLKGFSVFFKGTTGGDTPVAVRLRRGSGGTGFSAITPDKFDTRDDETIQTTARQNYATTEPSYTSVHKIIMIHPQNGYDYTFPPDMEPVIAGGGMMGIEILAAQAQTAAGNMVWEE